MPGTDIKTLADTISTLTIAQASSLAGYLKSTYGIEPAATPTIVSPKPPPPPIEPPSATVDVILKSAGDKKIQVIRVVRQYTSLGLKEAKDLVDAAPKTILTGVDRDQAEKLRKDLEEQGAAVELR